MKSTPEFDGELSSRLAAAAGFQDNRTSDVLRTGTRKHCARFGTVEVLDFFNSLRLNLTKTLDVPQP